MPSGGARAPLPSGAGGQPLHRAASSSGGNLNVDTAALRHRVALCGTKAANCALLGLLVACWWYKKETTTGKVNCCGQYIRRWHTWMNGPFQKRHSSSETALLGKMPGTGQSAVTCPPGLLADAAVATHSEAAWPSRQCGRCAMRLFAKARRARCRRVYALDVFLVPCGGEPRTRPYCWFDAGVRMVASGPTVDEPRARRALAAGTRSSVQHADAWCR